MLMATQDPFFNFYGTLPRSDAPSPLSHIRTGQIVGRKTVWLAPPSASAYMFPYPSPPAIPPDADTSGSDERPRNPAANTESPSMSNTSCVDVFSPSPAGDAPSEPHAAFWKHVPPVAMSVTLEPGDLLFFPPGWWHAMRSEETSFSVSMWF